MMTVSSLPLISVIVPVYKVEPYLRRCLDSICRQSYTKLEIICVDDGSPDKSIDILREFEARDFRVKVVQQPNGGLSAARNAALEIARGEWVTGVDADDWLEPGIYEKAVACLSDDIDMLCFEMVPEWDNQVNETVDTGYRSYFYLREKGKVSADFQHLSWLNVCFWNKLWRRSLIEKFHMRFGEGMQHEDFAFFTLFMPDCRAVYLLGELGYHYFQREDSIMGATRVNPALQEDYFRQALDVAEQVTQQSRWHQSGHYFSRMLRSSWNYISRYCPEKADYYRKQYYRLVFQHQLPVKEPKRFKALMLSPLAPDVSRLLPNGKKSGKLFLAFHYTAYLLRILMAFLLRDKAASPIITHEGI